MYSEEHQRFYDLLCTFHTAMLITRSDEDHLCARPMAIAAADKSCDLWFFTHRSAEKVREVEAEHHVHISCQRDREAYLSISGVAEIVADAHKIDELWQDSFKEYFPDGPDDPDLALILFHCERAEYWDNTGWKKARFFLDAASTAIGGTKPAEQGAEQHGRLNF